MLNNSKVSVKGFSTNGSVADVSVNGSHGMSARNVIIATFESVANALGCRIEVRLIYPTVHKE